MATHNLKPFHVGQEVVRIVNSPHGKIGDKHTVFGLSQCLCCKGWAIDIGKTDFLAKIVCGYCDYKFKEPASDIDWYQATSFAPITSTFQHITLEKVLEEETKLIGVN